MAPPPGSLSPRRLSRRGRWAFCGSALALGAAAAHAFVVARGGLADGCDLRLLKQVVERRRAVAAEDATAERGRLGPCPDLRVERHPIVDADAEPSRADEQVWLPLLRGADVPPLPALDDDVRVRVRRPEV